MPIVARKKKSQFEPAPEGLHAAVCVDVWEPWTEERPAEWGGGLMDKTRIVWVIEEENPKTGKPFEVSQMYTFSLHEKSNLSKHLESWRGKKFTNEERLGFDIEKLIGVNCQIQVIHKITDSDVYANVQTIVPPAKGGPRLLVPEGYQRKKDRDPQKFSAEEPAEDDSEEVPF
jgi:hypothetical protein